MKKRPTDIVPYVPPRRQFTVKFRDGSVLDLLPFLPRTRDGLVLNPSKNTRAVVARIRPDKLREYDEYAQRRARGLERVLALVER
jgi:hypothetical protein